MDKLKKLEKKLYQKAFPKKDFILTKKKFTIVDINRAGFNLEPTVCRNCGKPAFLNFGMSSVLCEYCGLADDGSSIKKQMREQGIK
jgi:hypothetical protein